MPNRRDDFTIHTVIELGSARITIWVPAFPSAETTGPVDLSGQLDLFRPRGEESSVAHVLIYSDLTVAAFEPCQLTVLPPTERPAVAHAPDLAADLARSLRSGAMLERALDVARRPAETVAVCN